MRHIFKMIGLLILGPMAIWANTGLYSDFTVRNERLVPIRVPTSELSCSSQFFLVRRCSFSYSYKGVENTVRTTFIGVKSPESFKVLRSADSGTITNSIGQDYLIDRLAANIALTVASLLVLLHLVHPLIGSMLDARKYQQRADNRELLNRVKTNPVDYKAQATSRYASANSASASTRLTGRAPGQAMFGKR